MNSFKAPKLTRLGSVGRLKSVPPPQEGPPNDIMSPHPIYQGEQREGRKRLSMSSLYTVTDTQSIVPSIAITDRATSTVDHDSVNDKLDSPYRADSGVSVRC